MLAEMHGHAEPWVAVASTADERQANELGLVLTARARAEIAQYVSENRRAIGPRRIEEVGDGAPGVLAYVAVLVAVFFCLHVSPWSLDWFGAGRLVAGRVVAGEWWRTVTALTVHVELDHLGGNLVFGAFFGYFIGRYFGRGIGWLAVLVAAALANAETAFSLEPAHGSIGASTAVFAALGILTAYTWRRGFLRETPWRWRVGPIVAGLGLFAFTGAGAPFARDAAHLRGARARARRGRMDLGPDRRGLRAAAALLSRARSR